ncbi:hypothetical protein FACS1894182_03230 [Bacteroidia bacterium]|nr:hypothetical protein FACS1894182_03230 [Bacteroidia bacterium]
METTFDKFITNDPKQRVMFDKEYTDFAQSENALERSSQPPKTSVVAKNIRKRHKTYATA